MSNIYLPKLILGPYRLASLRHRGVWTNDGLVYAIRACGTNVFKVGLTKDIRARLTGLQDNNPFDLALIGALHAPDQHLRGVERVMHVVLREFWMRGEWFDLGTEWRSHLKHAFETAAWYGDRPYSPIGEYVLPAPKRDTAGGHSENAITRPREQTIDFNGFLSLPC